jgi:hypothetical protein
VIARVELDTAEEENEVEASIGGKALRFDRPTIVGSQSLSLNATRFEANRVKRSENSQFQWLERLFTKSAQS